MRLVIRSVATLALAAGVPALGQNLTIVSKVTTDGTPAEATTSYLSRDYIRDARGDGTQLPPAWQMYKDFMESMRAVAVAAAPGPMAAPLAAAPRPSQGSETVTGLRPRADEKPLWVAGDVKAPRLIHKVEPSFPDAAVKARMEGFVILEAIVTSKGAVEAVRVLYPVNPLLDAAAVRSVQQWKYEPATLRGKPVRVYLTVTVPFKLKSNEPTSSPDR